MANLTFDGEQLTFDGEPLVFGGPDAPSPTGGLLQRLPSGLLLAIDGKLMTECCCDCADNMTVADFSYAQASCDTPFLFNFFDESVVDPRCGSLSYKWFVEDELVSTDQNPVGIELPGAGPWFVALRVTDGCGCSDSVSMLVTAISTSGCVCDDGTFSHVAWFDDAIVTVSGVTNLFAVECTKCAEAFNGTFTVLRTGHCQWSTGDLPWPPDEPPSFACGSVDFQIGLAYTSGEFRVALSTNGTARAQFHTAPIPCTDPADFAGVLPTTLFLGGSSRCDFTAATVTVQVPPPVFCS